MIAPRNAQPYLGPEEPRLWLSDYDDTQFLTSSEAPASGIDVNEAYRLGLAELLGKDAAVRYKEEGHGGRNPAQIVSDSAPDLPSSELTFYERGLIQFKLDILLEQIGTELQDGTPWPRPTAGFIEFMLKMDLAKRREQDDELWTTGIVSAGHKEFIDATYDLWSMPRPDILITDDIVQERGVGLPPEARSKPSSFLMHLAREEWSARIEEDVNSLPNDIIYTGDDEDRDGQFARNGHAEFVLIPRDARGQAEAWRKTAEILQLGSLATLGAEVV